MVSEQELEIKRKQFAELLNNPTPLDFEEPKEYTSIDINWDDSEKNWEECKSKNRIINDKFEDETGGNTRLVFIAHSKDRAKGKPQLIHQTIQKIPIIKKVEKYIKAKNPENDKTIKCYKFIDDSFDKRYDGFIIDTLALDFWVYRLIDNGREYYLLSKERLIEEFSEFTGMNVDVADLSGISDTLKLNKIANLFFVKEFKSAVNVLPSNELIKFTQELKEKNGWDEQGFKDFIFTHESGNIYDYTPEFNNLRIAQFLSGKYEGYPLHLIKVGPVGTGKTTEAEAIDFKFKEELGILEAGTSRMKVLVPSFKEKPANLGYICNCNRVAIIDELMKMVASSIQNSHIDANNYFGELNMLLEHKKRLVGSGNDNSTIVKTTAKVCITTNPLPNKPTIYNHLSVLDNTTLSRMLIWVQNEEEIEKIYKKEEIRVNNRLCEPNSREHSLERCQDKKRSIDSWNCILGSQYFDFLTIFDSCQTFISDIDTTKIKESFKKSVDLAKEPMKQVWKARGLHHTTLILDGLVKFRCLFRDYDSEFKALPEDYEQLDLILTKMIKGWDTTLDNRGFGI
jgi:hypothetical protein